MHLSSWGLRAVALSEGAVLDDVKTHQTYI